MTNWGGSYRATRSRMTGEGFSPLLTSLYKKQGEPKRARLVFRAGKGVRTLDIDLGKVALYQLSYSRESFPNLIKKRTL